VTDLAFLRRKCEPVKNEQEGGAIARKLIEALKRVNKKANRRVTPEESKLIQSGQISRQIGLGLAANQIGILKRVCVLYIHEQPIVLINPDIVDASETLIPFTEGCLSMPGKTAETKRHVWVKIKTLNEPTERVYGPTTPDWTSKSLLQSVVAQHEIGHVFGLTIEDFSVSSPPHPLSWSN